jgi:hypothetical protein
MREGGKGRERRVELEKKVADSPKIDSEVDTRQSGHRLNTFLVE